ncbi:DUF4082 domain-containing protein [Geobacter sp. SVR]|uniref:DUF4082 domain-containing protein n=1 Tax=Geobacter sp. SVR TaxID=2495594 RepID=UPI00143F007E|nr:DUF4082 domain-containing protein [Geobacter sp. SVR]BCS54949.1 hypothetical protein GSVR_32570 [Geobacter sp. SVR]GCF86148.1 hypothetical protein GSbR_27480 [Geobacter sp. SVR]
MEVSKLRIFFFSCLIGMTTVTASHARDVTLQWNANTETTVTGYKVYYKADSSAAPLNGTGSSQGASPVNVQKQTSATLSGLDPARTYYFAVTAYDASGTESAYSNIVSVAEATAPSVSITAPANSAVIAGTTSVTLNASDNVGVSKVELYVDGVLNGTDTATPYLFSLNTLQMAVGQHTLLAKAYDAAGNVGQSSSVTVTVATDTTPPTVSITSPAANAVLSGTASVQAAAADNIGVAKVELYLNGTLYATYGSAPYAFSWNTTSVANGVYNLTAKAYDAAGNSTQSTAVSVTVSNTAKDTTAPSVTAFSMPATSTTTNVPITAFTGSDNVGVTGYCITSTNSTTYCDWLTTPNTSFSFSGSGTKTAYGWVRDAAGNVSASKSATVNIGAADTTAPTVTAFSIPASSSSLTVAVSSFTASDNTGVTGYLLTESSTRPAASASGWTTAAPTSYTFGTTGSKTLYAWAKDAAGNVSAGKSATVTVSTVVADTTAPTVTAFSIPASSSSLTVAVSSFTASDNTGVTGYLLTESSTRPAATASGWSAAAPGSYTFGTTGSKTLYAWAKDAAGNVSASRSASTVVSQSTSSSNTSIWNGAMPSLVDAGADSPVELGVKFRSDVKGYITGIRFYKAATNTGTHVANLWNASGKLLASATFKGETASGWQQVNFATPVAIAANTVYVASYHSNTGHYSYDKNYFTGKGVDSPPLHALASGVSGSNGVYAYGSGSNFPKYSYVDTNYWVDVVFKQ